MMRINLKKSKRLRNMLLRVVSLRYFQKQSGYVKTSKSGSVSKVKGKFSITHEAGEKARYYEFQQLVVYD